MNIFEVEYKDIKRRMSPLSTYINTNALYVSKKYNVSLDDAKKCIKKAIVKKGFKDPLVYLYEKDLETLDKKDTTIPLSKFLSTIEAEKLTIAPSFTCYTKVKHDGSPWRSVHARMLNVNKKMRSHHKKLSREAKSKGDFVEADIQKTIDASKKMSNNGYSGASCQLHSPLATHSSHYTFTSATRVSTSTANVIAESMVSGYRSYYSPNDVLMHWNALLYCYNKDAVQIAIDTYGLKIPTPEDLMDMVVYSKYHYWHNDDEEKRIYDYAKKLTDLDRTAILYTFDMYHLIKLNKFVMDKLVDEISVVRPNTHSDYSIVDTAEEFEVNLMYHILSDRLVNKGLDLSVHKGTELGNLISSTLYNIHNGLDGLSQISDAFFKSEVLPPNIATYKKVIRRGVSLSDTDSSNEIYARLRDMRYGKGFGHNITSIGYVASLGAILANVTVTALSILTKNMNVDEDKSPELNMKQEYYFPLFAPTVSSKHYLSVSHIVEMLISIEDQMDYHGVALLSGNIDKRQNEFKEKIGDMIIKATNKGIKINPFLLIEDVKKLEKEIEDKILNLDQSVLVYSDIKEKGSYKNPHSSPYLHNLLYKEVFESKYGECPKLPYVSVNIPLKLGSKKKISDFILSISDDGISNDFANFILKYNKKQLNTIRLPLDIVTNKGIFEELVSIIDTKKIILSQMSSIRLVLAILNININDNELFIGG